jgi:hypothetical protein
LRDLRRLDLIKKYGPGSESLSLRLVIDKILIIVHGRRFGGYVPSQHSHFPLLALPNIYR